MRYSDAAGVENHPQITDFVPRRYGTIALLALTGVASTLGLAALDYAAPLVAQGIGVDGLRPFDLSAGGSVADWVASVVLLLASAVCLLVYSIRRHRIDDYRGRYRIWLAASAASFLLSANSVAGLHHVVALALSRSTGWSALQDGAVWWLLVAGLPLAWIGLRTFRDVLECRLAAAFWLIALGCYGAATASYLGLVPGAEPPLVAMLDAVLALVGHWMTLTAVVSYARYVVLDAQGLIAHRAPTSAETKKRAAPRNGREPSTDAGAKATIKVADLQRAEPIANSKDWIDGRRPEPERYDDGDDDDSAGPRKLSKADRKRLRKLKAQNRAA